MIFLIAEKNISIAQIQKGVDINGEAANDGSGWSVSMPDSNTVAIGAPFNNGNGALAGHTRIFIWNGSFWTQKGSDIDGEGQYDYCGWSVSMPDSNTIAIGAPNNIHNGINSGHVRIYTWNGNIWSQKGSDIDGAGAYDYLGWSISMSDSSTIAIGATNSGSNIGHTRIYSWNGSTWVQKGVDIDGEDAGDRFGYSVSMSDSNTVAIGAYQNSGNGTHAGHVRILTWNGNAWFQKGNDIDGEAPNDLSGSSVSMPDSNTVAIGAERNDGNGIDAGHVRIFSWNGITWIQKGNDIDGEAAGDGSFIASMPDPNWIAIGASHNDGNGIDAGHARIFSWNGTTWNQQGNDINGETAADYAGLVFMPDTVTIAIGATGNDSNGINCGHVRIYQISINVGLLENGIGNALTVYPNPTNSTISISTNNNFDVEKILLYDLTGRMVFEKFVENNASIDIRDLTPALYFYEVRNAKGEKMFGKILKQ